MAYALANGNFSNPANWSTGAVPGIGEIAYANGKLVTIDVDVLCDTITNRASVGVLANGYFIITSDRTITANVINGQTIASNQCVLIDTNSNLNITINGNLTTVCTYSASDSGCVRTSAATTGLHLVINGDIDGSATVVNADYGVITAAACVVTVTGNLKPAAGTSNCSALYANAANTVFNIVGDVYGGAAVSTVCNGVRAAASNCTINIVGDCYAVFGSAILTIAGCTVNVTGNLSHTVSTTTSVVQIGAQLNLNVVGNVYGGSGAGTSNGIYVGAIGCNINVYGCVFPGTVNYGLRVVTGIINCNIYLEKVVGSQDSGVGIVSVQADGVVAPIIIGEVEYGLNGQNPIGSGHYRFKTNYNTKFNVPIEDNSRRVVAASDADDADESDVRQGTTYKFGTKTGTLAVPPKGAVVVGVPTDDGVGTLNPSVDASALAVDLFNAIKASNDPLAARWRNVSTVDTTGGQLAS